MSERSRRPAPDASGGPRRPRRGELRGDTRTASRRRFPRWRVRQGRLVGPVVDARVLDLGPVGARIETARALRVGGRYTFTLELTDSSRRLHGSVRWCRLVGTREAAGGERRPVYRAGIVWDAERNPHDG